MSTKVKIGLIVLVVALTFASYLVSVWRHQTFVAGYNEREQARLEQIRQNEAEQNKLRGENDVLRKEIADLSASEEALKTIIKEHGGNIAAEEKKLEQIHEALKTDEAAARAPADKCVRCRRYSTNLIARKLIDKPLTCADECAGHP